MLKSTILALLLFLAIGCKKEVENILIPNCNASQGYEKSPEAAAEKIIGTWQLFKLTAGLGKPPGPSDQILTFKTAANNRER